MAYLTIIAAALLSFCLFFFNPLFIYFTDPERLGDLPLAYVVQLSLIATAVATGLALPYRKLGRRYSLGVCFFSTTVYLHSYVAQINFGLFRGNKFGNEDLIFRTAKLAYFLEPLALVVLFFLVRILFSLKKGILAVFFSFLFLSLGFEIFTMGRDHSPESPTSIGTDEPQLDLNEIFRFSKTRQNILLFIPDAGAGYVLPELMAENDRASQFDGFVHFANTVSVGSYTLSSTAALIGGESYFSDRINARNDKTILAHIGDAYNWLASALKQKHYESTFINPKFTQCSAIEDATFCSLPNRYKDVLEDQYGFDARAVFDEKAIRYFSLFKVLPFSLKPLIYRSSGWTDALEGSQQLATSVNK